MAKDEVLEVISDLLEAQTEVYRLQAENDRLRAALTRILSTPFNPKLLAGGTEWMEACTEGRLALTRDGQSPGEHSGN